MQNFEYVKCVDRISEAHTHHYLTSVDFEVL
ncbi:hypothetical protein ERO13_D05G163150v2 [Gossypium hirsutum]|nr:hypothetical protein ERO13_D05G163150v2 [Gossypium hirsutum]